MIASLIPCLQQQGGAKLRPQGIWCLVAVLAASVHIEHGGVKMQPRGDLVPHHLSMSSTGGSYGLAGIWCLDWLTAAGCFLSHAREHEDAAADLRW
jgi:hypothetical protein